VALPRRQVRPFVAILGRIGLAVGVLVAMALVVVLGREGYVDETGRDITFLSALYYASVSITTTGYGDITPVTDGARFLTLALVMPMRVAFLVILVGTTLEILTEQWREAVRLRRWRTHMHDHFVICGYGIKGRSAVQTLLRQGVDPQRIVVIDTDRAALEEANRAGLAAVHGNASRTAVLDAARIDRARAVVVAPNLDDTSVLVTLTARELNPAATIVAAVREVENAHLLTQSGADSVITSTEAAGRLLGLAIHNPRVVGVIEDLLTVGEGLDVIERDARPDEIGGPPRPARGELPVAVVRGSETLSFGAHGFHHLRAGDRIVCLCSDEQP
jgi:voltage-gated potassium channel